jgi:hypothetical protein
LLIAFAANTHFPSIVEPLYLNPDRLNTFITKQHDIGAVNRRFTLDNSALTVLGIGPGVALDDIYVFDQYPILFAVDLNDFADLAVVLSGDDLNLIVFSNLAFIPLHNAILRQ